ncbi:MAG TPA: ABC transporter substrate-binding protein [Thermoanaerobaculia bacterium]|nr:ABC transporter substrate-binding protein [Thermoanaerobaculia bacterium]
MRACRQCLSRRRGPRGLAAAARARRRRQPSRLSSACAAAALLLAGLSLAGCLGAPPGVGGTAAADVPPGYDPGADPLLNPPQLFAPFPHQEPERADLDGTLLRHAVDTPTSLNPMFLTTGADSLLSELLFDGLVYQNPSVEAVPNPVTVEEMRFSEDRRTTRIRLRDGLRWHDGRPWTAHDVRFSWQVAIDPRVPIAYWRGFAEQIADIEVIDHRTLVVTHQRPTPIATEHLRFPIIPRHVWDHPQERAKDPTLRASAYHNHWAREQVVGSGPYRLVRWVPGDRLIVERWEDYPGERARFARQIFKIQPDRNTALLLFKKRQLDEVWLTVQQFAVLTGDRGFRQVGVKAWAPRRMIGYISWNVSGSNPFFSDRRVRRAMAHAYDLERMLRVVTHNVYLPSTGPFEPGHWSHDPSIAPIPYDLEEAARLLEEAGWRLDPDDGWRYREVGGRRVRFDFEVLLYQTYDDAIRMLDIYRDALRRIGVSFQTRKMENAALVERLRKREFQALAGVGAGYADPDIWRDSFHSSAWPSGQNYTGFADERVDDLFDRARDELDFERRAALYREVQAALYDQQPYLFLWTYATTWGFAQDLRGVTLSPVGVSRFRPGPRAWWRERAAS